MKKPWPVFDWKLPLYCDQRILNDLYRGPGFLVVVWFGSVSPPPPLLSVSSTGDTQEDYKRETRFSRERDRGGGGRGAETYDRLVLYKLFNTLWLQLSVHMRYHWHFCCLTIVISYDSPFKTERVRHRPYVNSWLLLVAIIWVSVAVFFSANWTFS